MTFPALTDEQRTETLLDMLSPDCTLVCGCMYWREDADDKRAEYEEVKVRWCSRHTPGYLVDEAVEAAT